MNLVTPYARLMDVEDRCAGIALLRRIEWIGRISHRSEDAQSEDSWERFLRSVVLNHGDWSIAEHVSVSVDAVVDRGITHEWVRHRLFSFTQQSTRFVNHEKKNMLDFIMPEGLTDDDATVWRRAMIDAEDAYHRMLLKGNSPQIARSVLPNALASRIIITGNLRNWHHLLLMRTTKETHPQFREVTLPLLAEFQEKVPILFEDIEPMTKQSENLRKMR